MEKTVYVGNLPYSATETEVKALFGEYGNVISVRLITDRDSGRPRGFGFVTMEEEDADRAMAELDSKEFNGRTLRVRQAKERRPRD